jgi:AFG3 family protein
MLGMFRKRSNLRLRQVEITFVGQRNLCPIVRGISTRCEHDARFLLKAFQSCTMSNLMKSTHVCNRIVKAAVAERITCKVLPAWFTTHSNSNMQKLRGRCEMKPQYQQQRFFGYMNSLTSSSVFRRFFFQMNLDFLKLAQVPRGFEDFFPNGAKGKQADSGTETAKKNDAEAKETTDTERMNTSSSTNGSKNSNKKKKKEPPPPLNDDNRNLPGLLAMLAVLLAIRSFTNNSDDTENITNGQEITFVDFRNQFLIPGLVEKIVVINHKTAVVHLKPNGSGNNGTLPTMDTSDEISTISSSLPSHSKIYFFQIGSVESLEEKLTKAQSTSVHPESWVEVQYVNRTNWTVEFIKIVPFIAMLAATYFGTRGVFSGLAGGMGGRGGPGGGIFSIGKSNARKIKKADITVTFADVAGCDEAKREIMEFVDFLKDSTRFTKLGAKIPKGALLCGPPGTGKTLLAKAVAGEAGVPFYSISGSDFIEMFVGVGPSRVRDLFKEARANSPCIIFIDEIDAVGRQRGRGGFSGGNDERENTLNQLLVEMDGFSPTTGIVVLAGTNRADVLDQALTRPGRFDRQVQVDLPDLRGRKDIFAVHLKGIKLEGPIESYAGRLAGLTPGFAGADIANICNEAAIVAARRKAESVSIADFDKATDRIIGGLESNKIMSKMERSIVAHHEAGHAIAGWFLEHADPLLKVTIIPRTSGALGFAQYLPKEVFLRSQDQIMDIVCMALAGRAAEEVFFGNVTTGASDDLRRVTGLVYSTIKDYGMNSKVGQLSFPSNNDTLGDKPYSDSTAEAMDDEARSIVDAAYLRTVALIRKHKDETEKVANLLLQQETITHDDIVDLVGPRPFQSNSAYQQYVSNRNTYDKPHEVKVEEETETGTTLPGDLTPGLA